MGRCGWSRITALMLAGLLAGCGGTGGGPSDSGNQFVFQARGRLSLVASLGSSASQLSAGQQEMMPVSTDDPTVLTLLATLLDPQGNPFRNKLITFVAEFNDVTFIPQDRNPVTCDPTTCSNRGAVLTDDNGQAQITLIAGLTTGRMRIIAEAPPALNIATGITVIITNQGFVTLGQLGIIPAEVIFVNPLVRPGEDGPMTIFNAVGGTPPDRWDNSNKDLGEIEPIGLPKINEKAKYTLIGPIPVPDDKAAVLEDTVRLLDADGSQATATVTVIFAECTLRADGTKVTLIGVAGAQFQIDVSDGVAPFTETETFPGSIEMPEEECDTAGKNCRLVFTLPDPPRPVNPDDILVRDARGCIAKIELTVNLCGNGVIDENSEECDGSDFDDLTCASFGKTGPLFCTDKCKIDDSKCQAAP